MGVVSHFTKLTVVQGPAATVEVVRKLVQESGASLREGVGSLAEAEGAQKDHEDDKTEPSNTDGAQVAAEVADTAETLDKDAVV